MTLDISPIVPLSGHARLYQELAADKNRSEEIEKLHRKVVICPHARKGEMPEIPNGGWLVGLKSGAARQRLQISCILAGGGGIGGGGGEGPFPLYYLRARLTICQIVTLPSNCITCPPFSFLEKCNSSLNFMSSYVKWDGMGTRALGFRNTS